MPLKNPDPFASRAERLSGRVNPYVTLLRDGAEDGSLPLAFGPALDGRQGQWRAAIAAAHGQTTPARRLVLEIGCHKGKTLRAMAAAFPDTAFLGLDITFKRVVTTAQRLKKEGLTNAFCALANAQGLDVLFAPGELAGCVIFFPDPWVKKERQAKHRLVNDAFCAKLATRLAPGGFVWLKTDQQVYFEGAAAALAAAGLRPVATLDDIPGHAFSSAFEERFAAQNIGYFAGIWVR